MTQNQKTQCNNIGLYISGQVFDRFDLMYAVNDLASRFTDFCGKSSKNWVQFDPIGTGTLAQIVVRDRPDHFTVP